MERIKSSTFQNSAPQLEDDKGKMNIVIQQVTSHLTTKMVCHCCWRLIFGMGYKITDKIVLV